MFKTSIAFKRLVALLLIVVLAVGMIPVFAAGSDKHPLEDKKILFAGDSIGAGWRDEAYGGNYTNEGGWSARIAELYGAESTLAASAGCPISTIREAEDRPAIVNQLHANKNGKFDYVILQGGFNDAMGTNGNPTKETAAKVGEMTDSFEATDFDTATFAGALENLFYYAKEYFPSAKVGFIINYATPLSTYGGYTAEEESMRKYWDMAKAVCDKWGVSYLDLFSGKTSDGKSYSYDILKVDTSENFPGGNDNIHLNSAGYDLITPYIAQWIPTTSVIRGGYTLTWEKNVPSDALVYLDFEEQYLYNEAHAFTNSVVYYNEGYAENWNGNGEANNRGNNSKLWTGIDGNTAVQFTWDSHNGNENYNANGLMNIYNPKTASTFIGEAGKWYNISFKVKVQKSDNIPLQFYLATSGRTYLNATSEHSQAAFYSTDCNFNHINAMKTATNADLRVYKAGSVFTAPTDGWVTVSANWYADGVHFPVIGVTANNKTKIADLTDYAVVLVDDVYVFEATEFVQDFENTSTFYDGTNNKTSDSARGTNAGITTLDDGNKVVSFNWDGDNGRNYNDANAITILNPLTSSKFVGEAGKTYTVSFDYKITNTDGQSLQFYISACGRGSLASTDMGPLAMQAGASSGSPEPSYVAVSNKFTSATTEWATVTATFTANGTHYPVIILQANDKNAVSGAPTTGKYASAIIDNVTVKEVKDTASSIGFEVNLNKNDHGVFYNDGGANNWTGASGRGNNASWTTDGNNSVIRFTWDNEQSNENYGANNAMKILNPTTGSFFMGEVGTEYVISFKYKVERTDGKALSFYLAPCNRKAGKNPSWAGTDLGGSDLGPMATIANSTTTFIPASAVNADGEWHTAYANWTGRAQINGHDVYPLILLEANGKTADSNKTSGFASVLVDDITVTKNIKGKLPAYNYDGDVTLLEITKSTTFADLMIPERKGWIFDGFYTNAALTDKAANDDLVGNYKAIYVKWAGDGTAMTPSSVKNALSFSATKAFDSASFTTVTKSWNGSPLYDVEALGITLSRDKHTDQIGAANVSGWQGEYRFSADSIIENDSQAVVLDNVSCSTPANSIMFYVELPDFAAAGKEYALALGDRGVCLYVNGTNWVWMRANTDGTSTFAYTDEGEWKTGTFSSDSAFTGLPSGYKGYIRIDFDTLSSSVDFAADSYQFNCIELEPNALGGKCGDLVLGGIVYVPAERRSSTVWKVRNTVNSSTGTYNYSYYDIASSTSAMGVNSYGVYSDNYAFSTRYSGTSASPAVKLIEKETSAFWADGPVSITTTSGKQETTKGYMTTYTNSDTSITLQPGVDSFMFYVELPEFEESTVHAPLKLLDTVLYQAGASKTLIFSNSAYSFASVTDGVWVNTRAGADGDLFDIPSGYKGFIRFNVKDFKNYSDISYYDANGNLVGIDMSKPYSITKFELGFNHIGGKEGELTIGGVYSVIVNSAVPFLKNGITGEKLCFKAIPGDYNADGAYSEEEIVNIRKTLIGCGPELDAIGKLRAENNDITTLVAASKGPADTSNEGTNPVYPEIFSADVGSTSGAVVYSRVKTNPANYQVIAQDYEAYREKCDAFAAEVLANQIGTFEKSGIDKMCHVSTFYYSHGKVYASYYANTVSASENPAFQVARLAYAPENDLSKKVIIDIMQVGDELYGKKITGVYDTILMPKEDEPDNLYILWTAAVNGEYYRLYQVFNMKTEELGPIGVNRFKVGNTTNDFSREGMKKALNNEGHGYKQFASDIGIMQKLSTRVENGETYYYTGAYCCDFTCIIKSKDLITWEYVAQPNEGANGTGFDNCTRWENAVYVVGDKVYYYVRQWDPLGVASNGSATTSTTNRDAQGSYYGILTAYDLITGEWETPILVEDCQSRSDFIMYKGNLYLIYAPTPEAGGSDRQHLGILKIDTNDLSKTKVVLQAQMKHSCFYPFWQFNSDGELCISYTYNRQQIRLVSITLSDYLD